MHVFLKAFLFLGIFSLLHFGYTISGWEFLKPICGTDESVFQHLKMGFWAYGIVSVTEYLTTRRRSAKNLTGFWYARLGTMLLTPWMIFVIWYLLPLLTGRPPVLALELSWAIAVTYIVGVMAASLDAKQENATYAPSTRVILLLLVLIAAALFVGFTYRRPWIDVFSAPEMH